MALEMLAEKGVDIPRERAFSARRFAPRHFSPGRIAVQSFDSC